MEGFVWLFLLVGGVIGFVLVIQYFDYAAIILTSLIGGLVIVQILALSYPGLIIGFLVVVIIGIIIQGVMWTRENKIATVADHNEQTAM